MQSTLYGMTLDQLATVVREAIRRDAYVDDVNELYVWWLSTFDIDPWVPSIIGVDVLGREVEPTKYDEARRIATRLWHRTIVEAGPMKRHMTLKVA